MENGEERITGVEKPRTWGERGGGEWKAKLFIQPAAAEGGRRCSEGERRLAKQGRGREACTLVAGG